MVSNPRKEEEEDEVWWTRAFVDPTPVSGQLARQCRGVRPRVLGRGLSLRWLGRSCRGVCPRVLGQGLCHWRSRWVVI